MKSRRTLPPVNMPSDAAHQRFDGATFGLWDALKADFLNPSVRPGCNGQEVIQVPTIPAVMPQLGSATN